MRRSPSGSKPTGRSAISPAPAPRPAAAGRPPRPGASGRRRPVRRAARRTSHAGSVRVAQRGGPAATSRCRGARRWHRTWRSGSARVAVPADQLLADASVPRTDQIASSADELQFPHPVSVDRGSTLAPVRRQTAPLRRQRDQRRARTRCEGRAATRSAGSTRSTATAAASGSAVPPRVGCVPTAGRLSAVRSRPAGSDRPGRRDPSCWRTWWRRAVSTSPSCAPVVAQPAARP